MLIVSCALKMCAWLCVYIHIYVHTVQEHCVHMQCVHVHTYIHTYTTTSLAGLAIAANASLSSSTAAQVYCRQRTRRGAPAVLPPATLPRGGQLQGGLYQYLMLYIRMSALSHPYSLAQCHCMLVHRYKTSALHSGVSVHTGIRTYLCVLMMLPATVQQSCIYVCMYVQHILCVCTYNKYKIIEL